MSETLVCTPDTKDDIEGFMDAYISDIDETEYTIEGVKEENDLLYITVTWGSETDQVFYIEEREGTTDEDRMRLEDMLEHYNFPHERTDAGNWRIFRGGYE